MAEFNESMLYNPYDRTAQAEMLNQFSTDSKTPPPYVPLGSFLDKQGALDPRVRLGQNQYFTRLSDSVARPGMTRWGQAMLSRNRLGLRNTLGGIRQGYQRGITQGLDTMASRGYGLGGGATERLVRDSGIGQMGAMQRAYNQSNMADLGIMGKDFLTKQNILQQLESRGRGIDQANIKTRMDERNKTWADMSNRRNELLRAWGGIQEAKAS